MREMEVRAWSDSDRAGDPLSRKSVTRTVIKNGGRTLMVRVAEDCCADQPREQVLTACAERPLWPSLWNVLAFYMGGPGGEDVGGQLCGQSHGGEEGKAVNDANIVTKVQTGGILRGHLAWLGYELSDSTGHKALFF